MNGSADSHLSIILITLFIDVKHMLAKAFKTWRFAAFLYLNSHIQYFSV